MAELPTFADWLLKSPHRPGNATTSDNDLGKLLASIGRLTVTWEATETLLAFMFQRFCQSEAAATLRAYGSITGSGARCDMILSAAVPYFNGNADGLNQTKHLISVVRRIGSLRNAVAHSMIMEIASETELHSVDVRDPEKIEGPLVLTPALYNTNKTNMVMAPTIAWNSEDVDAITGQIFILSLHLHNFLSPGVESTESTRFRFNVTMDRKPASGSEPVENLETKVK